MPLTISSAIVDARGCVRVCFVCGMRMQGRGGWGGRWWRWEGEGQGFLKLGRCRRCEF